MARTLILIPIFISFLITVFQLLTAHWLLACLWLFVFTCLNLAILPAIKKDVEDKHVPVLQIFVSLLLFIVVVFAASLIDLGKFNLNPGYQMLLSVLGTVVILAFVMTTKGK